MVAVANVRVNTQVPFPAMVTGTGGISVTKTIGGVWQVGPTSGSLVATGNSNTFTALQNFNAGIGVNNLSVGSTFITPSPVTLTGTSGTLTVMSTIINSSGAFTLTLPNAVTNPGQWLYLKNVAAHAVTSASSNVVPLNSTTAGTAIITGTAAGDWVQMQSDGAHWVIMAGVIA